MQGLTCADYKVCSLGKLKALFQEIQYKSQGLNEICGMFHFKENSVIKIKLQNEKTRGEHGHQNQESANRITYSNYLSYKYCHFKRFKPHQLLCFSKVRVLV